MTHPHLISSTSFALVAIFSIIANQALADWWEWLDDDHCCQVTYTDCEFTPGHPEEDCRRGKLPIDIKAEGENWDDWMPGGKCYGRLCLMPGNSCIPMRPIHQETANGLDDDCDGFVDDAICDNLDSDNDGYVDEDVGSCVGKILFVPLCWQGTQEQFEATAADQYDFFASELDIDRKTFLPTYLSVVSQNAPCPDKDMIFRT
jgi:hypothetical protein